MTGSLKVYLIAGVAFIALGCGRCWNQGQVGDWASAKQCSTSAVSTTSPGTGPAVKRVFVSSAIYSGNLGGLSGADSQCQTLASAAGLGGNWKAWLSTNTVNAISRINDVSPWYLVDKTTLVFPTFASITVSGPAVAISMTETGATATGLVWTSTGINGNVYNPASTCLGWTFGVGGQNGDSGGLLAGNVGVQNWTSGYGGTCNNIWHIYCFEQ